VEWYRSVLGLTVLSPPYLVEGDAIERDMGELVPSPVAVKAAILGFPDGGDRVLEIIEYPRAPGRRPPQDASVTDHGFTHVGLVCDDIAETRAELEGKGVRFLTRGTAEIVGLRTTWFADPHGLVFILLEKREPEKPYFAQY
jgi:catechol 2,3-dioxygenase-like lactoylglutathione lyase family enzyme